MRVVEGIIIVLGSPNDDAGNLSRMALARADTSLSTHKKHPNYKFLLTGGYGEGFNRTSKPHAYYLKEYLIAQGIHENEILEFAQSAYTADDAFKALSIVKKYNTKKLIIVSSDFHMDRVSYIFNKVFDTYNLKFVEAAYLKECKEAEQKKLAEHEINALRNLQDDKWLKTIETH